MNKLIKLKILAIINITLLSFITHFIYSIIPSPLTAILFPVNESIFEHMKIIYTTTLIYGMIDYLLLNKFNIKYNNFLLQLFLTSTIGIILYLIIYIPIRILLGEKLIISILLLIIVYILMQLLSYYLLSIKEINIPNILIIILIMIIYILFAYLTYNTPHNIFFYDTNTKIYGIKPLTKK